MAAGGMTLEFKGTWGMGRGEIDSPVRYEEVDFSSPNQNRQKTLKPLSKNRRPLLCEKSGYHAGFSTNMHRATTQSINR